jgi:hypothetical protein
MFFRPMLPIFTTQASNLYTCLVSKCASHMVATKMKNDIRNIYLRKSLQSTLSSVLNRKGRKCQKRKSSQSNNELLFPILLLFILFASLILCMLMKVAYHSLNTDHILAHLCRWQRRQKLELSFSTLRSCE